ncbi:hypothetical protein HY623_02740 [Candidatus Uhrbacteria bacterium]|nr:hypothetical protein [Candidatus Uhrbacteria bacterium]
MIIRFLFIPVCLMLFVAGNMVGRTYLHANTSPAVLGVTVAATSGGSENTLTLIENSATTIYAHGTITDADGCEDVVTNGSVAGVFYRSNHLNGASCSADNNDCYAVTNANCAKTGCDGPGDTTFSYECTANIQYYADSTTAGPHTESNWTARITATDASTATGNGSDTIEIDTTVALNLTPTINYGTFDLGAQSAEQAQTITNTGNSGIDIDLSASGDMSCTSGVVPAGNARYALSSDFDYDSATALSTTPTELELNLTNRTNDGAESTKNTHYKLKYPTTGVGGTCSNTLTVTARADTENGW